MLVVTFFDKQKFANLTWKSLAVASIHEKGYVPVILLHIVRSSPRSTL
jgi:hypothetical protein